MRRGVLGMVGAVALVLAVATIGAVVIGGLALVVGVGGSSQVVVEQGMAVAPPPFPGPQGPQADGTRSQGLPIVVEPAVGIVEGQEVLVSGTGFSPGASVGVVMCLRETAGGGGVRFCDVGSSVQTAVGPDGAWSTTYPIRRHISTAAGEGDCGAVEGACMVAAGNISNYDESGAVEISFAGAAPAPPPPVLTATPAAGLVDGQLVSLRGEGLRPGSTVPILLCDGEATNGVGRHCDALEPRSATADADGVLIVEVRVHRVLLAAPGGALDCADAPGRCTLATSGVDGNRPGSLPLTFDPDAPEPATPTLTVDPATDLPPDAVVTVSGAGFRPGEQVELVTCAVDERGVAEQCSGTPLVITAEGGTFTARIEVARRTGGADCAERPSRCRVLAYTAATAVVGAPLAFTAG